jgi:hypothetical protein
MEEKARRIPFLNHLLLLVIAGMVAYLVVDFGRQVAASNDQKADLLALDGEIAVAEEETARLTDELAYAQSPEAGEEFGRSLGWGRENEVVVVVGPATAGPAAPADEVPAESQDAQSNHQAWWELFFGER